MLRSWVLICCVLLHAFPVIAGSATRDIPELKQLIETGNYPQAQIKLEELIAAFSSAKQTDSLAKLPYFKGIILNELYETDFANQRIEQFIQDLTVQGGGHRQQFEALKNYTLFLDETGQIRKSFEIALQMLELIKPMPDATGEEIGKIQYDLGVGSWSMGDMPQARGYFSDALKTYQTHQLPPSQNLADAYNAMGAMMWLTARMDSAAFYYERSVQVVGQMDADTVEKAFLSAVTLANIGLLYHARGQTSRGIKTLEQVLNLHNFVIANSDDPSQKHRSEQFRLRSTLNLASFYNTIGNYRLAHEMTFFVYNSYKEILSEGDPEIYKALIRLGESRMSMREYGKAKLDFEKAIELMQTSHGENAYWKAIAFSRLAETHAELGNTRDAKRFFGESRKLFDQAMDGQYDRYYISTLGKAAVFYASEGMVNDALHAARTALQFARESMGDESPSTITQTIDMADVYFQLGEFENSANYSRLAIEIIEKKKTENLNIAETFQLERHLPGAIMLHSQSLYQLSDEVTDELLSDIIARLQHAREVLNRRKMYFASGENILALMDENRQLFNWKKYMYLQRYRKTSNQEYLQRIADLHEYSIFQKIRLGFLLRNSNRFFGVPEQLMEQEFHIARKFSNYMSLNSDSVNEESFEDIIKSWEEHLVYLKTNYPYYFKMRFGDLSGTLNTTAEQLDGKTTIVRYLFINNQLFALVITNNQLRFFELDAEAVEQKISRLNTFLPESVELNLLRELYAKLWQPLEEAIQTSNIIILPDGYLFNLAFETLIPGFVESYRDLARHSLLKRHVISYNFSLAVMNKGVMHDHQGSYVAFVPGFADDMKKQYAAIAEINQDEEYMQLLPQPFTLELVQNIRSFLGGQVFTGDHSTLANFITYAGNQKILHLGTHAQVNNVSPGFSRLIFAKDIHDQNMGFENHLYAHNIYQLNLRSQLTVLTACETGRPFYKPGEGMISLAHAFHYAGSESMLTSLWQIDEHASAIIVNSFYAYLAAGESKAEALRNAKLDYLATARGRTLAPVYWAGVILMGDPGPMEIQPSFFSRNRVIITVLLIVLAGGFWWFRKKLQKLLHKVRF